MNGIVPLHAPTILTHDVGNVLGRRAFRPAEDFDAFLDLSIMYHSPEHALLRRTLTIQRERKIIFFDAVYLALAEHLRLPLLTDDRDLLRASRGIAVPLESYSRKLAE